MTTVLVQTVVRIDDGGSSMFRVDDLSMPAATVNWSSPLVAIIITVGDDPSAARHALRDLRAREGPLAYVPVLVIDAGPTQCDTWVKAGSDQMLTAAPDGALLDLWTIPPNAVIPRLIQHFGQDAIVPLFVRFRASLLALQGAFVDGDAHQVGGLAGTLGYSALGAACEALQDDPAVRGKVLREVRKAIYDVSRHLATYAAR